ncbi:MAG: metal ABC transporter permease [Clostridia bacterium]|nr:metal ABC transporter permease [Clostridia bacterium]MBQ1982907.1 metal ABC transporter permease [Clostridia bacterium]MBQ5724747.1 metal ABC transporter permease [Clostridia bacterium]
MLFDTLIHYFSYPFVRYALIAGVLISLCAGLLGVVLVLRRYAMIGDGLSHVAFGAMAVAAVLGLAPMAVALPVTVAVAVLLLLAGEKRLIKGDAAIAMLSAGSLAVGYLLLNLFPASDTGSLSGDVCASLFGSTSMLTLSQGDVLLCLGLSLAVIAFFTLFYRRIFAVTFDEAFATSAGIRTRVYHFLIAAVSGVVIVLSMKLVGALLISSLVIFPALSSMRLFRSFRAVVIASAVFSVVGSLVGIVASLLLSTPTGASIAATHILLFALCSLVGRARR